MEERSSVRKYKRGEKIPRETLEKVLKMAGTAPSAWNLQHWKFVVVEDQTRKDELVPIAYGQEQVSDASAVIIVLGDTEADQNGEIVYKDAPTEVKETLLGNIKQAYENVPNFAVDEAIRNASFAAMQLMLAAKALDLDTCPIGGFDRDAIVEKLNIPQRYLPSMMITIGYAAAPAHPTDRFSLDEIVVNERF
ncbi:nitroreductase family protein [Desertibacillus haloalkaliphilus]|uniref:nitroreductase family protein n=1 Tax=Desertibacillus haloalkaliphilus TaxID=1328930 RepID=UPI001C265CE4|nr:nitroreductase family protein [Desertibacillus haloalkaliphilus]MBU8907627.1 nitroreductase family protein [Desertibacillus haloalkaliphilus]